jgi:hypothetical protein
MPPKRVANTDPERVCSPAQRSEHQVKHRRIEYFMVVLVLFRHVVIYSQL